VAAGDRVHLGYIRADGSLMYAQRNGGWSAPLQLSAGPVYGPSLSLDTATSDLYVLYSRGGGHADSSTVRYTKGSTPYGAPDWSGATVLAANRWMAISDPNTNGNYYTLHSNYAAQGKLFAWWVEGMYGLESISIPSDTGQAVP
jgi:hypothetical protein